MIRIFGRSSCEWTSNALLLCSIESLDNEFFDLNLPVNRPTLLELEEEGVSIPAIYNNQMYIGGYQAFQSWIIRKKEEEEKWRVL